MRFLTSFLVYIQNMYVYLVPLHIMMRQLATVHCSVFSMERWAGLIEDGRGEDITIAVTEQHGRTPADD